MSKKPVFIIEVSIHGKERILERLKCTEKKVQQLAEKAWRSTQKVSVPKEKFRFKMTSGCEVRYCMGYAFIFQRKGPNKVILVTFY